MPPVDSPDIDREAGQRYLDLLERSPAPIVIYDDGYELVFANRAAAEVAGASDPGAVVGRPIAEFVHPDDRDDAKRRARRVIEDREPVESTGRKIVDLDGETRHVEVTTEPVIYEGAPAGEAVLQDVTAHRERARALERERDRFETLFENLPTPVVHGVADDGEPIVRRVNPRFEEVFGYDQSEIEGENLDEYIVPEDRRERADRLNERILTEGRIRTEVRRETVDGPRDFLLHIVARDLDADRPEGYSIYTDITERRRRERELERQNERLEEFASVVSHDLRNPLSVARGRLGLLKDEFESGNEHVAALDRAHERMEAIIDDLLTLARQGEAVTDPEPVELAGVARDAWRTAATEGADLRFDGTLWVEVRADPGRLRECFENLFRNAVEHGSTSPDSETRQDAVEHGSTSPPSRDSADAVEHDGDVTVTVGITDDENGFYVADDGPGIPPDDRELVFEAGYSTAAEGTGFGLNIVSEIVEAHGWEIEVTDGAEGGARFEITGVDVER